MPVRTRSWRGFRGVLCGVDFSEQSRLALRHADEVARRAAAPLTVLYVNDPLVVGAAAVALRDRNFAERSRRELRAFAEATLPKRSSRSMRICLGAGRPTNEILRIAARSDSDLIVLGTHGLTGADRWIVGSTTLNVLRRTTVPVLAVPNAAGDGLAPVSGSWPGERIMAAVELDAAGRQDMATAAELARWLKASLLLVHVVDAPPAPAWLRADRGAHDRIRISQAQRELERLTSAATVGVSTETRVLSGAPADEIAVVAAAEKVSLLITGLRDRPRWFGARRGSVSYHVLTHAVTPVLACPPRWRPQ